MVQRDTRANKEEVHAVNLNVVGILVYWCAATVDGRSAANVIKNYGDLDDVDLGRDVTSTPNVLSPVDET